MKNIFRIITAVSVSLMLCLVANASNARPVSEVYKYFNFKLPPTGYHFETLDYTEACKCMQLDMYPNADLKGKTFTMVFGVYKDDLGSKFSTSVKLKTIKELGGKTKLINGKRWWYQKNENGTESYSYEMGKVGVGYRVLIIPDEGIEPKALAKIQRDVAKVLKSLRVIQSAPTEIGVTKN